LAQLKLSGKPSFGMQFVLSSEKTSNNKGSFFMPKFTMDGLTGEEECESYFDLYRIFANKRHPIGAVETDDDGDEVVAEGRF